MILWFVVNSYHSVVCNSYTMSVRDFADINTYSLRATGRGLRVYVQYIATHDSTSLPLTLYVLYIVSCPSLTDPNNGVIICPLGDDGVPSFEDTCSFTCNTGYVLTGSDTRTCQGDGSWSGSDDVCTRGGGVVRSDIYKLLIFYFSYLSITY